MGVGIGQPRLSSSPRAASLRQSARSAPARKHRRCRRGPQRRCLQSHLGMKWTYGSLDLGNIRCAVCGRWDMGDPADPHVGKELILKPHCWLVTSAQGNTKPRSTRPTDHPFGARQPAYGRRAKPHAAGDRRKARRPANRLLLFNNQRRKQKRGLWASESDGVQPQPRQSGRPVHGRTM